MHVDESDRPNGYGDEAASLTTDVVVPADGNEQSLDVGSLTFKIEPMLRARKPAPAMEAASLSAGGAVIHLSDSKRKYVLIHLWSVLQPNPDATHTVDMAALDEEFGSNGKVALIGIDQDPDRTAARAFVAKNHLDHWVIASAPMLQGLPEEYKRIYGGAVLIGPDGNVIAKHLAGDQLAEMLRLELAK